MAYYRSSFVAADERAKHIQGYIAAFNDKNLSEIQRNNLIIFGNALLGDLLLETDYQKRLDKLNQGFKDLETRLGRPVSKVIKSNQILKLQMEYVTRAGVFGRPQLKVVTPTEDGKEGEILSILENDMFEDGAIEPDNEQ